MPQRLLPAVEPYGVQRLKSHCRDQGSVAFSETEPPLVRTAIHQCTVQFVLT